MTDLKSRRYFIGRILLRVDQPHQILIQVNLSLQILVHFDFGVIFKHFFVHNFDIGLKIRLINNPIQKGVIDLVNLRIYNLKIIRKKYKSILNLGPHLL